MTEVKLPLTVLAADAVLNEVLLNTDSAEAYIELGGVELTIYLAYVKAGSLVIEVLIDGNWSDTPTTLVIPLAEVASLTFTAV